jgi:hypothetical protein
MLSPDSKQSLHPGCVRSEAAESELGKPDGAPSPPVARDEGGGGSGPRVALIGNVGHAWAFKWYLVCVVLQLLSRVLGFPAPL